MRSPRCRRMSRHLISTRGEVVALDDFELVGNRILDASAEGALIACDRRVELGQNIVLSFPVPGSGLVFDAEAEITRIIHGMRTGDPGYCAGVRYTDFDRRDRLALGIDLRRLPLAPRRVRWSITHFGTRASVLVKPNLAAYTES